jgi:hypothetical protein
MSETLTRAARERATWERAYTVGSDTYAQVLWTKHIERLSHIEGQFYRALGSFSGMRILSIGGGVDRAAVYLANRKNHVVTADISHAAASTTLDLENRPIGNCLHAVVADCQEQCFRPESFDAIICKRALHHMEIGRTIDIAHALLVPGGVLLAEEPVCLTPFLRFVHKELPFHPQAIRSEDERELREDDLRLLETRFQSVNVRYFDLLARESIAHFLCRLRMETIVLRRLGRLDDLVANRLFRCVRRLCSYVILECRK